MGWLSKLTGFENLFSKNFAKDIWNDPTRLLTGVDPLSTKAWNAVTGSDNEALVNYFGSPGQKYYDQAAAAGIDTGPASQFHGIADTVAGAYATAGLAGAMGGGAAGAAGGTAGGTAGGAVGGATGGGGAMSTMFNALGGAQGLAGLAGGIAGAAGGGSSGSTTNTSKVQLDPRMEAMLYGNSTTASPGLLGLIANQAYTQQNPNMAQFGNQFQNLIGADGYNNWAKSNQAAQGLQGSNISAPQMQAASAQAPQSQWASAQAAQANMGQAPLAANSWTSAAQVGAPAQNGTNLNPAFNNMIYGNPAENDYLKQSIQGGIDQSMAAFKSMQADATDNLTEKILPSIRGSSIMSGGFGGSRQALAEGGALGDFSKQMATAAENFGRANTTAAVGAQAQAFDNGQNRALSAMGQLNGNQYGTAMQNAGFQQQANQQNSSQGLNNNQFNSSLLQQLLMGNTGYQQQANLANAGWQNQNNQFNAGLQQQTGLANAGWQQQANQANMQSQQNTNQLNSANQATGIGLAQGLGNQAFNWAQAQENAALDRFGRVGGLLGQFSGLGQTTANTQPYYTNTAANVMGGASAALGLYNQFAGLGGNSAQNLRNDWAGANSNFTVGGSGSGGNFNVSPGSAGSTSWLSNFGF
ncbi:hypothetical protein OU994_18025 [Pseudoduganella sp. SL102]|uniref:hypothetical protein n=1 Tax=Pseudoduganella sp. SL102 TaxID=2995154 RepID=UPI00248C81F2|nr:hypothetical protein [Pseudoduganella sp. SL102]WBS00219.1 hypothetical protein OU994_18025 [Pseudoduganella sp. SL102]